MGRVKYLQGMMKHISQDGIVVEIGCWLGETSEALETGIMKYNKNAMLYCIDPWDYPDREKIPEAYKKAFEQGDVFDRFKKRMSPYIFSIMRMKGEDAVVKFRDDSVDLVFLDANHEYQSTKETIINWIPKIKSNGVFCGHDYVSDYPGVIAAVDECFSKKATIIGNIWTWTKK
jgi:predicted O-methyltransferase YrrM